MNMLLELRLVSHFLLAVCFSRRYYDEMNDLDHLMEMQPAPTKMKSKKKVRCSLYAFVSDNALA